MKKIIIASLIATGFVASSAQAATATLTITASVAGKCMISTTPSAVNLPIDPVALTGLTGTSSFAYKCTKGQPATITSDTGKTPTAGGVNQMKDLVGNLLKYTLTLPTGSIGLGFGTGTTNQILASIGVAVASADAQVATASIGYTDDVLITVTP